MVKLRIDCGREEKPGDPLGGSCSHLDMYDLIMAQLMDAEG